MPSHTAGTPTLRSLLTWMRECRVSAPVKYDPGLKSWHVFDYDDVERVLADPRTFSSDFAGVFPGQLDFERYARGNFLIVDPPRHRRLRKLVTQSFTVRRIEGLAGRIADTARELLDNADLTEEFDFAESFAFPLPVIVIAELLGIPAQDRGMFRRWADALLDHEQSVVRPDEAGMDVLGPALREMNAYLLEHIRQRRARPRDDLVSALAQAGSDGMRLDDEEVLGIVALLLLAGHFTTSALLVNTLVVLAEHPSAAAELRGDRELLPSAIDEVLRYRPSFPRVTRRTTRPVELGGCRIAADELVVPWIASANRDARQFSDPDVFDIRRFPNRHLSLGHGIHYCLGAPLARLEAKIVVNHLFDRFRSIDVVDQFGTSDRLLDAVSIRRLPIRVEPN